MNKIINTLLPGMHIISRVKKVALMFNALLFSHIHSESKRGGEVHVYTTKYSVVYSFAMLLFYHLYTKKKRGGS